MKAVSRYARAVAPRGKRASVIQWLDIGSGDGTTIHDLLRRFHEIAIDEIELDCIEPDSRARELLKWRLGGRARNVWGVKAHELAVGRRYDLITCIHSSYYFGVSEEHHLTVWRTLLGSLTEKGILIVVALPASSPLFDLASPVSYQECSKADILCEHLRILGAETEWSQLRVRYLLDHVFKLHRLHSEDLIERLRPLVAVLSNDPERSIDPAEAQRFMSRLEGPAQKWGRHSVIDFGDWVIRARIRR